MKISEEVVDGQVFLDVALTPTELDDIVAGECVTEFQYLWKKQITVGVRLITDDERKDSQSEWEQW